MTFKKLLAFSCVMLLLLTSIPLKGAEKLDANASFQAVWPVEPQFSNISTFFNSNRNTGGLYGGHNGIDIPANFSTDIYASVKGVCYLARWMGDYGNLIILWHENLGVYTFYAHCNSINVVAGQRVSAGDIIGYVGDTGNSYGNHLHFGICDTLLGDYPTAIYYDPLSYFTYTKRNETKVTEQTTTQTGFENTTTPVSDVCNCSEEYAGTYITKNISTYLNVRSGHGANFDVVGKLYPNNQFEVIKADGKWAYIKCGDISGHCSMDYIQPLKNIESKMTLSKAVIPPCELSCGKSADLDGVINSNLPITRFTGGIYQSDRKTPVYVLESYPNTLSYSLSGEFDEGMLFNKLGKGTYFYKVEAEDSSGKVYSIIGVEFTVIKENKIGDINDDGVVTISDGVILQKYLLGSGSLLGLQQKYADITGDSYVDIFDMITLKEILSCFN